MNSPVDELNRLEEKYLAAITSSGLAIVDRETGEHLLDGKTVNLRKWQAVAELLNTRAESPDGVEECKKCGDYGYIFHGPTVIAGEIGESSELCDCPAGKNLLSTPPPVADEELIERMNKEYESMYLATAVNPEMYLRAADFIKDIASALQSRSTPSPPVAGGELITSLRNRIKSLQRQLNSGRSTLGDFRYEELAAQCRLHQDCLAAIQHQPEAVAGGELIDDLGLVHACLPDTAIGINGKSILKKIITDIKRQDGVFISEEALCNAKDAMKELYAASERENYSAGIKHYGEWLGYFQELERKNGQ